MVKDRAADLATLVIAILIAALLRVDGLALCLVSYASAWLLVNVARALGWPRDPVAVPKLGIALACVLVVLVPVRDLASRWTAIAEHEALASPLEHLADRLALEADPAIAPGLVSGDRPQTFFVRASGAHVRVRLGESIAWIEAEGLGHGVFRVDYDPREAGLPPPHETRASIEVDGATYDRTLLSVVPQPHPRWLRVSPDRTLACVPSEETDEVVVVSIGAMPRRRPTEDGPTDCVIADDGSIQVAHRFAPELPGAGAIEVLDGERCVARAGEVRCGSGTLARSVGIEGIPLFLARVPGAPALVLATRSPASLVRIEVEGGVPVVRRARALVTPAVHLAVSPNGARVVVALTDLDPDGRSGFGNHFVLDRIATYDTRTLELREDHPTAFRTGRQDHAGDVDRGVSPMGLSFGNDGWLRVAFAGTDEIEVLGGPEPRVIDTAPLGLSAPFSVVEMSDGSLVVTSPSSGLVVVLDAHGDVQRTLAMAPDDHALLASDPDQLQLRFGERAFYEATRSGVSCQSCHLHGGTDGAAHNIGGRILAPTLDVRGVIGTSPYLRDGSYPRLSDLHEVAVTEYRGYRLPGGDRGATMEAWMRTLPPPPTFVPRDPAREREGLDVFFRAGCPECHAPPAFTSLGLHAIEAVFPGPHGASDGRVLDVPSLRSVAVSAPYLYDGRAETLESVIGEHNEADRHGHTRALAPAEREALVTFLRSL